MTRGRSRGLRQRLRRIRRELGEQVAWPATSAPPLVSRYGWPATGCGTGRDAGRDAGRAKSRRLMEPGRRPSHDLTVVETIDPQTAPSDHFAPGFVLPDGQQPSTLFFDLETTGLSSADSIFLAGMLQRQGPTLLLRQQFAGDVIAERALLKVVGEAIRCRPLLVTYNGRCFDVPFLRRRLAFHGLPALPDTLEVIDLLLILRRRYGRSWPDCRLATAERLALGKRRTTVDVPGAQVPRLFDEYQLTGCPDLLAPVIYHNRIDLTSMVALLAMLGSDSQPADPPAAGGGHNGSAPRSTAA